MRTLRAIVAVSLLVVSVPLGAQEQRPPLMLAEQGSFFVGGRTIHSNTLSTVPDRPPVGDTTVDQMYVRYQIPVDAARPPIVLIHGCCLTGKTWETTPDGRMGWDEYFVRQGHPVYNVDQASRGRSAVDPNPITSVRMGKAEPGDLPQLFSASHEFAWATFRFGPEFQRAYPDLKFPVEAVDEFYKQMVPDWYFALPKPNPTVPALVQLAVRLGSSVLMSHSQSGVYPFQVEALNPKGIAAIVSIEPGECPSAGEDISPYTKIPAVVVWGDYVELSTRWAPRLKGCRAFAEAVNKAGGSVENLVLPDIGIRGNSHMLMQDRNSLAIADLLLAWIDRHVRR